MFKGVESSDYTTTNNTGNIQIDSSQIKATGISYDIATIEYDKVYEDGILTDSSQAPLVSSVSPYNSISNYQRIGNDSLSLPEGSFIISFGGSPSGYSFHPSGGKYKIEGNRLILTLISNVFIQHDENETTTRKATAIATLERQ